MNELKQYALSPDDMEALSHDGYRRGVDTGLLVGWMLGALTTAAVLAALVITGS
jgi:hypothetical protein